MELCNFLLVVCFIGSCCMFHRLAGEEPTVQSCPFNPDRCVCETSWSSAIDYNYAECNATEGVPSFEKPAESLYTVWNVMTISGNIVEIPKQAFAAFSSINTLNFDQKPAGRRQNWDADAFEGVSVLTLQITNLRDIFPLPAALKPLGSADGIGLRILNITEGGQASLQADTFADFPTLIKLSIERTTISFIDKDAFAGLSNLKTLSLKSTSLTQFPQEAFAHLPKLKTLVLSGNNFNGPAIPGFSVLPDTLTKCNLDNNGLTAIPNGLYICGEEDEFYHLSLADNNIASVNSTDIPFCLSELDLSGNPITNIDLSQKNIPDHLDQSLRYVSLQRTNLSHIDLGAFSGREWFSLDIAHSVLKSVSMSDGGPQMVGVVLTNTGLERIDPSFVGLFDKSKYLALSIDQNEHLQCDHVIISIAERVVCQDPSESFWLYIGGSVCANEKISLAQFILDNSSDWCNEKKLENVILSRIPEKTLADATMEMA